MMNRFFARLVFCALAIAAFAFNAAAFEGQYTGCKSPSGRVNRVAPGEEPSRPCSKKQIEFTFTRPSEPSSIKRKGWSVLMQDGDTFEPAPNVTLSCRSPEGITTMVVEIQGRRFVAQSESNGSDQFFNYQPTGSLSHADVIQAVGSFFAQGMVSSTTTPCGSEGYVEYVGPGE